MLLLLTRPFIIHPNDYQDGYLTGVWEQLLHRIQVQPINVFFFIIFILAVVHTFIAHRFSLLANRKEPVATIGVEATRFRLDGALSKHHSIGAELLDFLGELEVVFGFWCIPLFLVITFVYGWETTLTYINDQHYDEALFMVIAMSVAATYPITHFAEAILKKIIRLFRDTPSTWWFVIMTTGPLFGSLIKETVAIAITAILLGKYFFKFHPSSRLAYATIGLLFVNVSVGGMLTNFATSSVSIAAKPWEWDSIYLLTTFGWKALVGILLCNLAYFLFLRKDFKHLDAEGTQYAWDSEQDEEHNIPKWIIATHVLVLIWLIMNNTNPVIALGSFVLFLGFYQATAPYQNFMTLRDPIMVGFFIASTILIGGLQVWWIGPIVRGLSDFLAGSAMTLFSAFVPNTTMAYILTKIPDLSESSKQILFASTMIGGGLTIIANGTNIVAVSLLKRHFNYQIDLGKVFISALIPTAIMYLCYNFG